jgi:hypothetical protein
VLELARDAVGYTVATSTLAKVLGLSLLVVASVVTVWKAPGMSDRLMSYMPGSNRGQQAQDQRVQDQAAEASMHITLPPRPPGFVDRDATAATK